MLRFEQQGEQILEYSKRFWLSFADERLLNLRLKWPNVSNGFINRRCKG